MTDDKFEWGAGEQLQELTDAGPSRRGFLEGAAKVSGGALALSLGGAGAAAASDQSDELSDVDILNYALTLERLEATFYERGQEMFSEQEFERTDFAEQFASDSLQFSTYNYFNAIRDHERAHVEVISDTIEKLGGEPVSGLQFEFPFETPDEYIGLAQTFENLGVAAYAGVAPGIDNADLLAAALSIHSVEARHAGYLNLLNTEAPFPDAFDEPKSREEVLEAAGQFIVES